MSDSLVQEFLNLLEKQEAKLLTWGIVDGGFSEAEIIALAEQVIQSQDHDDMESLDLVDEMLEHKLIFDLNLRGNRIYRTRMAEAIRLTSRLRQLFPTRDWQISPTLVADYRFSLRQRVYPRRKK